MKFVLLTTLLSTLFFNGAEGFSSNLSSHRCLREKRVSISSSTSLYSEAPTDTTDTTEEETTVSKKKKPYKKKKRGLPPTGVEFDITGGRPGPIIEAEEDFEKKKIIFDKIEDGTRVIPEWANEYLGDDEKEGYEYDAADDKISKPGVYNIFDLRTKFDHELDPEMKGDEDPNELDPDERYLKENPKDEDGLDLMWDPIRGACNPIDTRTIVGTAESPMVDPRTRDVSKLTPEFHPGDIEEQENEEIRLFRKSLDIIETYTDPYLGPDVPVPSNVAKWHGHPIRLAYPKKDFMNNRFTKEEDETDFEAISPYRARKLAVWYAREKNTEWLPTEVSQAYHDDKRQPYEDYGTLMGTLREGEKDPDVVKSIEPALHILGSIVTLLSIEGDDQNIFRFKYWGLIKNLYGMERWTEKLIREECGVSCNNVVFETGFRKRDPLYDGGDPHYMIW
mmetsp:Transcript_13663/g.15655  ORF Transcript_13663/g.15655 Transcript_13663/m.15655 type:complete len:449 (+) Transcript_13663:161-1507(+)|eukprot:CAMPEP_0194132638 /NCGR_PEP_ID=MMETSP0152-20130528/3054_1 /TAXON_ID=1049557 /ORGANISM="Thalassiothrix antarctica, Strain L6-D1" /LENGTH=448 /DNA_ID=CAMNT_0038827747 /DNA_START=64 /DNA_END=1410 /DNA_ORIENTATION=-